MSSLPCHQPECEHIDSPAIEVAIEGRARDLGGFSVRRVLPSSMRRTVGPFIFFDHMGPATFPPGHGIDVRPHPHICLATITYLFEGAILHRDSLGSGQVIRPGDVNWMIAGRGIVHSERRAPESDERETRLHGLQTWVALPLEHEETAPAFEHHPASTLPLVRRPGAELRVVAGSAFGERAPTHVLSPTLYVHARLDAGAELIIDTEHAQRTVFAVDGELECAGRSVPAGTMVVLKPGCDVTVRAGKTMNAMLVGGAPLEGPRHIWWNFVSSSKARIERAKADWQEGRFPQVPGDSEEFIPLPS